MDSFGQYMAMLARLTPASKSDNLPGMEIRKSHLPRSGTYRPIPYEPAKYAAGPVVVRPRSVTGEFITTAPRVEQDRAGRIRTYTGRYVNPLAMRRTDICIEDIAHHLSNLCRYTGACPEFYSVAQHSVLVSDCLRQWGAPRQLQLAGLLHDAGEAYFNDIASPVKHDPRMKWYRDLEHETTKLIFCTFGLDPDLLAMTKEADDTVFDDEASTWWGGRPRVTCMTAHAAEDEFLTLFHSLMESAR